MDFPKRENSGGPTQLFLSKLNQILSREDFHQYCSWNSAGDAVVIRKVAEFSNTVLPQYFKHGKFSSFVRQLYAYGFYKCSARGKSETAFQHPFFLKDRPELFSNIILKGKPRKRVRNENNDEEGKQILSSSMDLIQEELVQFSDWRKEVMMKMENLSQSHQHHRENQKTIRQTIDLRRSIENDLSSKMELALQLMNTLAVLRVKASQAAAALASSRQQSAHHLRNWAHQTLETKPMNANVHNYSDILQDSTPQASFQASSLASGGYPFVFPPPTATNVQIPQISANQPQSFPFWGDPNVGASASMQTNVQADAKTSRGLHIQTAHPTADAQTDEAMKMALNQNCFTACEDLFPSDEDRFRVRQASPLSSACSTVGEDLGSKAESEDMFSNEEPSFSNNYWAEQQLGGHLDFIQDRFTELFEKEGELPDDADMWPLGCSASDKKQV